MGRVVRVGSSVTTSEMITCDSMCVRFLFNGADFASGFLDQGNSLLPSIGHTPFVYILSSKEVPFQPHELSIKILENAFPRLEVTEFLCIYTLEVIPGTKDCAPLTSELGLRTIFCKHGSISN